jgi:glycosyltransferase involved in cell wall biosynthesis
LEQADLLALPCVVASDGDRDSMPVVVKEALAMEVPVVGSDEVGMPEMIQSEWGRLVPPRDAGALAGAIRELLDLPVEQRVEMGRRGREYVVRNFSVRAGAQKLEGLIDRYGDRQETTASARGTTL